MSKSLSIINTAADTFGDAITKINNIIVLANTEVVTANSTGALTSGNGFVNGVFGSNTLVASVIQGGNVGTPGALTITANTMTLVNSITIGNSTVNSVANSTEATITTVKATTVNVGANVSVNTTSIQIGNSTANVTINSTSIDVDGSGTFTSVITPLINIGANVSINVTAIALGNSTTNAVLNTSSLSVDGGLTIISGASIALGNSTVNAIINNTSAVIGNSTIDGSTLKIGNSIVNVSVNSISISLSGNASLNSTVLSIGNSTVNASVNSTVFSGTADNALYLGGVAAADYQLESGLAANVATMTANNSGYLGGVAAADYQLESGLSANVATLTSNNALYLGGVIAAAFLQNTDSKTLSGNLIFSGANVVFSTGTKVGENVALTTTSITVGNSTANASINSTAIDVDGSGTFTSVITPLINVGANVSVNSTVVFLGNSTVNSILTSTSIDVDGSGTFTSVITPLINVGANVSVNSTVVFLGNSTVNAVMNSSTLVIDTINFREAIINSVTISEAFTVNVGTFLTHMNVGSNVQINTSVLKIGNSTVNASVNSTVFSGTADNALYLGGVAAADYQLESGLSANVATMTANNTSYLGGIAAAAYIKNTDSKTLSGNLIFSGANVVFSTGTKVGENVVVTTSSITVGNSTVNTYIDNDQITIGVVQINSSTFQAFDGLSIATVNSTVLSVPVVSTTNVSAALINVGANVSVNTTSVKLGNSTINVVFSSSALSLSGNLTINSTVFSVGNSSSNSQINSTVGSITTLLTSLINVGISTSVNATFIGTGNSTVNVEVMSSNIIFNDGASNNSILSAKKLGLYNNSQYSIVANVVEPSFLLQDSPLIGTGYGFKATPQSINVYTSGGAPDYYSYINAVSVSTGNDSVRSTLTTTTLNVGSLFSVNSSEVHIGNSTVIIDQRGSSDALIVRDAANDTTPLVIDASGIIIRGANASLGAIWAAASDPYFQQVGINVPTSTMSVLAMSDTAGVSSGLWLGRSRANTSGSVAAVQSGDFISSVRAFGASNTTYMAIASEIRTYVEGTVSDGAVPSSLRFYTSNGTVTEAMRIVPEGNTGIRNTAPTHTLSLGGVGGHAGSLYFGNSTANGSLSSALLSFGNSTVNAVMNTSTLTIGTVTETSDLSLKENVEYLGTMEALDIISALKGAKYNMKNDPRQTYGLIAQDVEQVIPEIVFDNGHKSLKYSAVIPILVEAIKELRAEVDRLKK